MVRVSYCECGQEKHPVHEACSECSWLDGFNAKEALIIDALRLNVVPANVDEIASLTSIATRSVLRSIKALIRSGRVIKTTEGDRSLYRLGEKR